MLWGGHRSTWRLGWTRQGFVKILNHPNVAVNLRFSLSSHSDMFTVSTHHLQLIQVRVAREHTAMTLVLRSKSHWCVTIHVVLNGGGGSLRRCLGGFCGSENIHMKYRTQGFRGSSPSTISWNQFGIPVCLPSPRSVVSRGTCLPGSTSRTCSRASPPCLCPRTPSRPLKVCWSWSSSVEEQCAKLCGRRVSA